MEALIVFSSLLLDPEIERIVKRFDSPDFRIREAASNDIIKFGPRALLYLHKYNVSSSSPEVKRRCVRAISLIQKELDAYSKIYPSNYPLYDYPRIDGLKTKFYPNAIVVGSRYARKALTLFRGRKNVHDDYLREATRLFVIDLVSSGRKREEIQEIINLMAEAERNWWLRKHPDQMPLALKSKSKAPTVHSPK